jgi:hypothetical protein
MELLPALADCHPHRCWCSCRIDSCTIKDKPAACACAAESEAQAAVNVQKCQQHAEHIGEHGAG